VDNSSAVGVLKKMNKTCLLDLPVYPKDRDCACATSEIVDAYLKERDGLKNPDEMHAFIDKWHDLWLLDNDYVDLSQEEQALVDNQFDHEKVYALLLDKQNDDLDFDDLNVRIMAHIAAPAPLTQATVLGQEYGVGTDLIMVRLYLDPYPELNEAMRYGSGDTRLPMVKQTMDE
jgi:hypothetical protein